MIPTLSLADVCRNGRPNVTEHAIALGVEASDHDCLRDAIPRAIYIQGRDERVMVSWVGRDVDAEGDVRAWSYRGWSQVKGRTVHLNVYND